MQKRNIVIGAGMLGLLLLAGCQSISDQIGKKVAEGVIGQAVGGDVKIDEKNGAMTIKTKDGEATVGGGDTRPASVPSDLPSLPDAKNFSWLGNAEGGILNYEVAYKDFKATCSLVFDSVKQAGWTENSQAFSLDSEDSMMKSMVKDGRAVTVICGKSGEVAGISMSYGKDTNPRAVEEKSETPAVESEEVKTSNDSAPVDAGSQE